MSLLGLDVGTTGVKAICFTPEGRILAQAYREYTERYPGPGEAELDPEEVWGNTQEVLCEIGAASKGDPVQAMGLSVLGEAVTPVSREGEYLHNSLTSVDNRCVAQVRWWEEEFGRERVFDITGMSLHPSYTLSKIMWFRDERPEIFRRTWKFLLYEDLVIYKLGLPPTIDLSLAGRTMALDVRRKVWSDKMLGAADLSPDLLADVGPSGRAVGTIPQTIAEPLNLPPGVIVVLGGHDQPANALGGGLISPEVAVDGMGTVECVTVGFDRPILEPEMLRGNFSVYPHVVDGMYVTLAFSYTGGSILKWFRDTFCEEELREARRTGAEVYDLILKDTPKEPTSLLVLPHFVGTGTPYLDPRSKGAILGLTLGTPKKEIAKALIEGVTFEIAINLKRLESAGVEVERLRAMGGGSRSRMWLQLKADITGKEVAALNVSECGCLGAALLAGTAIGTYDSLDEAVRVTVEERETLSPDPERHRWYAERLEMYEGVYPALKEINWRMG